MLHEIGIHVSAYPPNLGYSFKVAGYSAIEPKSGSSKQWKEISTSASLARHCYNAYDRIIKVVCKFLAQDNDFPAF